uniref:Replication-associated protein n=1 Tax=Grus japonensis CRESS-DNA-virus sp. TaxID=2815045 RepID=A0A8A4XCI4_9VIRU|nr:MAG: replication-associated protein [Grus japonensis CRESS-DNA-virus sp.]
MRTFGNYKNSKSGGARKVEYNKRESTQWDLRFDTSKINVDDLIASLRNHLDDIAYVLIGGKEFGTSPVFIYGKPVANIEATEHVHCALITKKPVKRWEALKFFRENKIDDEYCTVRNEKFTFLGWRLHHIKDDTKIDDKRVLFEWGTLPMDRINEHNVKEIKRMLAKFPGPTDPRYAPFLEMASDERIKRRKLAKMEAEIPVLREEIKQIEERRAMSDHDMDAIDRLPPIVDLEARLGGKIIKIE